MSVMDWACSFGNWCGALDELKVFVGPAFKCSAQRLWAGAFIDGLLSGAERKTVWMLAEEDSATAAHCRCAPCFVPLWFAGFLMGADAKQICRPRTGRIPCRK
jgi:hypothetical protein